MTWTSACSDWRQVEVMLCMFFVMLVWFYVYTCCYVNQLVWFPPNINLSFSRSLFLLCCFSYDEKNGGLWEKIKNRKYFFYFRYSTLWERNIACKAHQTTQKQQVIYKWLDVVLLWKTFGILAKASTDWTQALGT